MNDQTQNTQSPDGLWTGRKRLEEAIARASAQRNDDAPAILQRAAEHIANRGTLRDQPDGERSMARAVAAFNALLGESAAEPMTECEGWLFMAVLKMARATAGGHNLDDYEDGAAYFALAGECANKERTA